jgi:triosephosphate isomerase
LPVLTVYARDCGYSGLSHIETRYNKEEIDRDAVHGLLKIIIRHGLGPVVCVHNLHRHNRLPADTVRVEINKFGTIVVPSETLALSGR